MGLRNKMEWGSDGLLGRGGGSCEEWLEVGQAIDHLSATYKLSTQLLQRLI